MSIQVSTLKNGLRIVTDRMAEAESAVVGVWVGVGTRHEPWNANGVAHLVEHMMFKGTKTRSAYALSKAIESKGGSMNAHTTREETAYYARVLPEDTEVAIDVIADMLRNSVFAPKELERERQVIIQEIGRDLDSPEEIAYDNFFKAALPDQKLGRPVLGTAKVIGKLPRAAVADYVARFYTARNMVIVAAGKVDHEAFVKLVEARFADLAPGKAPAPEKAKLKSGFEYQEKDVEQVQFIMGFPGVNFSSPAVYPMQVLSVLLGGSSTSRLFQKVREKRGLAYTIATAHSGFSDCGLFQVYAGTDPKRVGELVTVVCDELRTVSGTITAAEVARAKAQMRAEMLMGRESVMRRAEIIGHQMVAYNKIIPTERIVAKLEKVSVDETKAMARKLFAQKPILSALGPLAELEPYEDIVKRLSK